MNPIVEQDAASFILLLQETAIFLWKEWPRNMEISRIGDGRFTLRGECPHCSPTISAFPTVAELFQEGRDGDRSRRLLGIARCIACNECILAIIETNDYGSMWQYAAHYPLGRPSDAIPDEIPESIGEAFKEALRCQYVNAFSATAEMCRRAIETACLDLGAPYQEVLEDMIDWLEAKRIITPALKDVAHKIRLGGNRGAHPWKAGEPVAKPIPIIVIEKDHAGAIVSFTWHFLEHIYVIPKQLPQFDFSKPKGLKK